MRTTILQKDINPLAIQVCSELQQHGYQAFIVGGCVRDLFLETVPKDWDICTDASPEKVMEIFPRTLPTGLQHGTVTVCMAEGEENHFEVTTFRVEGKYTDGRRPEAVKFVQRVEEDLARRDLTINAIAFDPIAKRAVDPFAGIHDLRNGYIRAVGYPADRFQEDGLRIMRVARFAARFGYQIDEETMKGMQASLDTLKKVSRERVSDELSKLLMSAHPNLGLEILAKSGAMDVISPRSSQWYRNLLKGGVCRGELETRLAILYLNHSPEIIEEDLNYLKFSNKEIKRVLFLGPTLNQFWHFKGCSTLSDYRKFMARFKNEAPDPWEYSYNQFIELAKGLREPVDNLSFYEGEVVPARKELAINGNDLLAIGINPGPEFKSLLDKCYSEILENPEHNTKNYLLQLVQSSI